MKLQSIPLKDEFTPSDPLTATAAPPHAYLSHLILSLALTIFAIAPLFYPGYFQTHSGLVPVWNATDLRANLGNWRWLPHFATSFEPLRSDGMWPYYLASLLPLDPAGAVKAVFGLGWLLGSAGTFLWLKNWLGRPGAVVAALVYTYLPYQIATVYVRGAWGEAFFWGVLPWAMWAGSKSNRHTSWLALLFTALVWLLLGLSHLGLSLWAFIFAGAFLLATYSRRALGVILAGVGGLLLAALITLIISGAAISPISTNFFDHFLYPFQLLSAYWGFGPSRPGWDDGMSFQLGLAAVGLALLSIFLWQRHNEIQRTDRRLIFFSSATLVLILLQFGLTELLWRLPLFPGLILADTLNYPWQLSGLTGLCLAVLAGASLWLDQHLTRLPLFGSIIILIILSSYSYLSPQFIQIEPEMRQSPQALLGTNQVALLTHNYSVEINGNTAGLEPGPGVIPLAAHGPLHSNEVLKLNVTWQPLQAFSEDWKVFVHLVNANNQVLAQFDGQPLEGTYPTSRWLPGEFIKDSYPLLFPSDAPPGPYRVFIGLYNEATGARLPAPNDPEGRVILNVE